MVKIEANAIIMYKYIYVWLFFSKPAFGGGTKHFLRPSKKVLKKKLSVYLEEKSSNSSK